MENLNALILELRGKIAGNEEFIKEINSLIAEYGPEVCTALFIVLTGIDLPVETARIHWNAAQEHGRELRERLGRELDLTTVISDYLHAATGLIGHSRLVEIGSYERIVNESIHDSLTGLANRSHFASLYEQQIALARRYNSDLSILFLDIDNFKDINDNYGHIAGDIALKAVATIINKEKRDSDISARYGGEEFVVMMPHTSSISGYVLAERIRRAIEKKVLRHKHLRIALTISGGLASFPLNSQNPRDLLRMADDAVYLAKGAGKNTISLYKHEKRRYLRVKLNQPVLVQELGFQAAEIFPGVGKDISIGGILFENPVSLPIDAQIKVNVSMTGEPPLLLIGTVVRVEAFGADNFDIGMSVSFKEMEKSASRRIGDLLRQSDAGDSAHL
ncbi:MAG: diguanylate cyclase [Desulfobulbaceae bacterium]|jgi:diguanylate cyclase (GGDEF)-like protein|nr:diguanylate cyclase [Desulfobulbaceae bacterium]